MRLDLPDFFCPTTRIRSGSLSSAPVRWVSSPASCLRLPQGRVGRLGVVQDHLAAVKLDRIIARAADEIADGPAPRRFRRHVFELAEDRVAGLAEKGRRRIDHERCDPIPEIRSMGHARQLLQAPQVADREDVRAGHVAQRGLAKVAGHEFHDPQDVRKGRLQPGVGGIADDNAAPPRPPRGAPPPRASPAGPTAALRPRSPRPVARLASRPPCLAAATTDRAAPAEARPNATARGASTSRPPYTPG